MPVFGYRNLPSHNSSPQEIGRCLSKMDLAEGLTSYRPFPRRDLIAHYRIAKKKRRVWWRKLCKGYEEAFLDHHMAKLTASGWAPPPNKHRSDRAPAARVVRDAIMAAKVVAEKAAKVVAEKAAKVVAENAANASNAELRKTLISEAKANCPNKSGKTITEVTLALIRPPNGVHYTKSFIDYVKTSQARQNIYQVQIEKKERVAQFWEDVNRRKAAKASKEAADKASKEAADKASKEAADKADTEKYNADLAEAITISYNEYNDRQYEENLELVTALSFSEEYFRQENAEKAAKAAAK